MGIKKKNITNLIRAYTEKNDNAFRDEAYKIACIFSEDGDDTISEYIISLLSESMSLAPQMNRFLSDFFRVLPISSEPLFLPDEISKDLLAVGRLINERQEKVNKFMFMGGPGTGKTEAARQLGRITHREVFSVDFSQIVDSKLGQTAKNISKLFDDINSMLNPENAIIIFDEIDSIALDRINERDHREMGRATTEFLKGLDGLNKKVVIIGTTNLKKQLDHALVRRFDMVVDFDRYTEDDLAEIATQILSTEIKDQHKVISGIGKVSKKFFKSLGGLPNPGELKNSIRVAVALSEKDNSSSLFSEIARRVSPAIRLDENNLRNLGFTIREIEQITGTPKSSLSRRFREKDNDA